MGMQAEAALDTLNKKDLGEAKSLKKPPAGVDDVTAVVIILLEGNPKDKSWAAAQKLMNNVDKFLERLKTFKSASLAHDVCSSLQPWFCDHGLNVAGVGSMCQITWVIPFVLNSLRTIALTGGQQTHSDLKPVSIT